MEFNRITRPLFKKLFMYMAYSEDISIVKITNNINVHIKGLWNPEENKWEIKPDNDLKLLVGNRLAKEQVKYSIKQIKKVCGYIPNNICTLESMLYIVFVNNLIKEGYLSNGQVEFVFDAIEFTDKTLTTEICERILAETAKWFMKVFKNKTYKKYPFNLQKQIDDFDYYAYHACWSTTENHYREVFKDPTPIDKNTWKEIKEVYQLPKDLRLSDIYQMAKKGSMKVNECISKLTLANVTKKLINTQWELIKDL